MPTNKKKKRSKKRQLKEKKKMEEEQRSFADLLREIEASEARKASLEYLDTWKNDKENWKFSKTRERWLCRSMYSIEKVPTKSFKIMIKYLEGMYMNDFRKHLINIAREMVENESKIKLDNIHDKLDEEERKSMTLLKKKRALKVLEKLDK
ncbi:unnamed protein product [Moneuplotes crassus]|uniref:WKF domain-containing protein n=1 Tax=Euplotes crassus TaxID=5936 RepID=A0AAD1XZ52_EUPCR|nr:unnamed protein product [Moneuplotes crassus]CAI2381772.1 unnamed protein product [Moneuplotes crassus]